MAEKETGKNSRRFSGIFLCPGDAARETLPAPARDGEAESRVMVESPLRRF
jgi:hypothetical protein